VIGGAGSPGQAPDEVHSRGLHLRQVDYEPVVAQGIAGDVVPAAADGKHEPRLRRPGPE